MSDQARNQPADETEDPGDSRLTELVAYLDGELDELDADRVERQLVIDAPLRSYAETLDRTWRLLDSLGEATASGEFTQKTLASLDAQPLDENGTEIPQARRWSSFLTAVPWMKMSLWCLVGFLSGTAGLLLSRSASPAKSESADAQMLRQLDLLLDYQKVRPIPDLEFLKALADAGASSAPAEGKVR